MAIHETITSVILFVLLTRETNLIYGTKIEVDQGWLVGKRELSEEGRTYFAFRSIPFAAPPVGQLRFEPPRPPSKWEGVLYATKEGPFCAQAALGYDEGEEDCLHLSIYTPKLPQYESNASLPVLIWIPGGAFVTGGAREYSPHLMMDRDLILVIPQYRLGVLGYFSTHSPYAIGNYGSLDQLAALEWVNQNIMKFGGDPNRVTLGGDCAGGVSSVLHMLSPLSRGLFHRVISFSGSPLSHWTLHPKHNRLGLLMSNFVKCPAYDLELLTKCFRERSVDELLEAQKYILEARDLMVGNHKLAPSIQVPAFTHVSSLFLEEHPLKLLLRGDFTKVPVLLSVTRDVGSYLVDMALYEFIFIRLKEDPQFLQQLIGILVKEIDILDHETKAEKFQDYYLSNWDFQDVDKAIPGLSEMLGDSAFNAAILSLAKILSADVETRLFRFDYEDGPKLYDLRHSDNTSSKPPIPSTAVSHGDELYFFLPSNKFDLTTEHKLVVAKMLEMIEDFVYGREPFKKWPVFTPDFLETTILTSKGEVEKGVRFIKKDREEMLQYIFQNQHEEIFDAIQKEGEMDTSKWKHDEF